MEKRNLLILGAGQYGQVVREVAAATGMYNRIAFLDDRNPVALGKLEDHNRFLGEYSWATVAMGDPVLRRQWLQSLVKAGFCLPVLIHPMASVSPTAVLGEGTVVEPMAVVHTAAVVETGGLLCAGCVINHNSHVESVCQIDCGAVVEANALVPAGTKVPALTVFSRN